MIISSMTTTTVGSSRKPSQRDPFSEIAAHHPIERISSAMNDVVTTLHAVVFATENQVKSICGVSRMSLHRYYHRHLIDRYLLSPRFGEAKWAYALGELGRTIIKQYGSPAVDELPVSHMGEIVRMNEVGLRIWRKAQEAGHVPTWMGAYEVAALLSLADDKAAFYPRTILQMMRGISRYLLIDFHAVSNWESPRERIQRYEAALQDNHWSEAWVTQQPLILFGVDTKALADEYAAVITRQTSAYHGRYLGKLFQLQDTAPTEWWDFRQQKMVNVLAKQL